MHRGRVYRRVSICAAVLCGLCLFGAPAAIAAEAAADQYVAQQPSAGGASGNGTQGVAGNTASGGSGSAGNAETAAVPGDASGSLPFTGYPMTTLVWVVLALVLLGLAVRLGVGGRRRLGTGPRSS